MQPIRRAAFLLIGMAIAPQLRAEVETVQGIGARLVNERGAPEASFGIPAVAGAPMLLRFRPRVDEGNEGYRAWFLDVTDPTRKLSARVSGSGKLPREILWDGKFPGGSPIEPGRRYFVKLILTALEGGFVASPWSFFSTRRLTSYDTAKSVRGEFLNLYIVPTAAAHAAVLLANGRRTITFPNVVADLQFIFKDVHCVQVRMEATSNILFPFQFTKATPFYFSDVSASYRFRLLGLPIRAPEAPTPPPTESIRLVIPDYQAGAFGETINAELGVRFFRSVFRSDGNTPFDAELAREVMGLSVVGYYDQAYSKLRLRLGGQAGYSVFRGDMLLFSAEGAITYERFRFVAPGVQLRYQLLTGTPQADDFNGARAAGAGRVTNHLVFLGAVLHFKL